MSPMAKKRRSVQEIIAAAGGPRAISAAMDGAVTPNAVTKWIRIGIPDRHWPTVLELAKATADEMLAANLSARSGNDLHQSS